jgi:hypothetical protein
MPPNRIIDLSAVATVAAGDNVPIYSAANGDSRRAPMSVLAAYLGSQITTQDGKVTQYASPSSSPFTTAVTNSSVPIWLVLTPTGTMAVGTLTLPAQGTSVNLQEILVSTSQQVTALTVAPNGSNLVGAPTTLAAGAFFRLRFDALTSTWYRVG